MKKENTARKTTLAFVIPVLIILAWYLATTYNDIPTGILPTIPMVGQAFVDMIHSKELQTALLISCLLYTSPRPRDLTPSRTPPSP